MKLHSSGAGARNRAAPRGDARAPKPERGAGRRKSAAKKPASPAVAPRLRELRAPVAAVPAEAASARPTRVAFPIVGIGASAGGLEAFSRLLRALPVDTGMAFVLVQHLSPTHESLLAEILSRTTTMPVIEVRHEPGVQPNHVYVIPPDRNMVLVRGHLRLFQREGGKQHPIDRFFQSLAEQQGELAIGVVLSGTATDGTLGLEGIKARDGITFAQDETAQQRGMPNSAVDSGCVDFVLAPEGIALELARIAAHPYVASRRAGRRGRASAPPAAETATDDLSPILAALRAATGVDFTQYKPATLTRRIRRRMVLLKQGTVRDYLRLLSKDPAEVEALYQDVLINVTSFFRDPAVFEALGSKVLAALAKDRESGVPLRVWVPGCSTGEEAYSLAMSISEALEAQRGRVTAQVFATDVNAVAIGHARAGVYTAERLREVSRERVRRFFVETNGKFRVSKAIREMCVFSRHNAIADPPFSRMDLISCRNMLIYLEPAPQRRLLTIFHYALKPGGFLVLGASEAIGPFRSLFKVADAKHKIFARKDVPGHVPPLTRPTTRADAAAGDRHAVPSVVRGAARGGGILDAAERLRAKYAPPAVLVDSGLEIVQFRGHTDPYLAPAQGRASFALMKMVREGLASPLRTLLSKAKKGSAPVRASVRFRSEYGRGGVEIEVVPVGESGATDRHYVILFHPEGPRLATRAVRDGPGRGARARGKKESPAAAVARLENELMASRDHVQALTEQHEAATEELQSANEEAQSANEDLQSINEELETSKEEIQSSNEELTTVNDELSSRNQELAQLNGDLANLITSVQLPIVIVGRDLRIRRHSPMAEKLLGLIPADVGRPLSNIRLGFTLPDLEELLVEVIDTITPKERETQANDGRWYSLRMRPYLTVDNKVDGAVVMFVDVDAIRHAREYAESIVATVRGPLLVLDDSLRVRTASRAYYEMFCVTREEAEGRPLHELGGGQWNMPELRARLESIRGGAPALEASRSSASSSAWARRRSCSTPAGSRFPGRASRRSCSRSRTSPRGARWSGRCASPSCATAGCSSRPRTASSCWTASPRASRTRIRTSPSSSAAHGPSCSGRSPGSSASCATPTRTRWR